MDVIDRLIEAVEKSGMKQIHIARVAHLHRTKLNKILKRNQVPTVPEFIDIARAIRIDPALLFTDGELVIDVEELRTAHAATQRAAEILAKWLPVGAPEPVKPAAPSSDPQIRPQPKPAPSRSATPIHAAADPNAELLVEFEEKQKRIPRRAWNRGARIIARAIGNSMDGGDDPIRDGALVYLKPTRSPRTANRHRALVRHGDAYYLKVFMHRGSTIRLLSTNSEQELKIDARGENMQVYGYVVDHE